MEKTRTDILIEKSRTYYNSAIKIIADVYDNVFSKDASFKYDKRFLLAEYDKYLQAALIKICASVDGFKKGQMNFLEGVFDYGKLVDGVDYNFFADCVRDMSDRLVSSADEALKTLPVAFKLVGAIDSGRKIGVTRALIDCSVKIAFNFKIIEPTANVKDNSDIISAFRSVYAFARANAIDLS